MPEYSKPINDTANSFVHTFTPEKATEANNLTFRDLDNWKTPEEREIQWERFWNEYASKNS